MIAIRQEIAEIESGRWKVEASPLRHAPHTVHDIADDAWARDYSRAEGCFPAGTSRQDKYWCPVGRVDNVYGDRNLVCSCPPMEDYAQAAEERARRTKSLSVLIQSKPTGATAQSRSDPPDSNAIAGGWLVRCRPTSGGSDCV